MMLRNVSWGFALLLPAALGIGGANPVAAQQVSVTAAPADWVRYAGQAAATISAWLEADDARASRLRAYLAQGRGEGGDDAVVLPLKLWIDAEGTLFRIAFPSPPAPEQEHDLRELLVGRMLPDKPPKGMLLPLQIRVTLTPASGDPKPS